MNGYQWTVLFAAWLGWGFDVFDGLLFNYVAPTCVPTLLGIPIDGAEAKRLVPYWTAIITSLLLIGWAIGGILLGRVADRIGRTRTLLLTMILYAAGTAACAFVPNIWALMICRFVASLGIGGEWAAGASMVAEVVPNKRRVEAGALLYTAAPMGLFLATYVTYFIQKVAIPGSPETSWRFVFLFGLLPAIVAFFVRMFIKEPERWKAAAEGTHPKLSELFRPEYRRITLSGLGMAVVALIMWWSCNGFIAGLARTLAMEEGASPDEWIKIATSSFNFGGLVGTLLTVPVAKYFGRKAMYAGYFVASAAAIYCSFGLDMPSLTRLYLFFFIGLTVFGIFGSFTYYLPELFPTRLRGTGAGFCYNAGRIIAAAGPFIVGYVVKAADTEGSDVILSVLSWVAAVPILGLLLIPFVIDTRGRELAD